MLAVILSSGCSSGIGKLAAEAAARAGRDVYATMRGSNIRNSDAKEALEQLAAESKLPLQILEMDVSDAESVKQAVETVVREKAHLERS